MVKVGILGAGYIADWHVKALRQTPDVQVVAVCDANIGRAKSFAASYGIPDAVGDILELVRNGRCDAVHVLLPPDLHFSAAQCLLEAGTHVFLEKPACVSEVECRKLEELSARVSRTVGVNHNFLFATVYERLKADAALGMIGPINEVSIVWNKELGQLRGGPFGGWMFRQPGNIMLEIGPHSVAHLLDLVGEPEHLAVESNSEVTLPNGKPFFRRWQVRAKQGAASADLLFSFGAGFTEHRIHVRGLIGTATADFEAGTYVLRRHSPLPDDFDRHRMSRSEGKALIRQARGKLRRYVLSKFKLSKRGNDFGNSIAGAIRQFYGDLGGPVDRRLSIGFATKVIAACAQIAAQAPASPKKDSHGVAEFARIRVLQPGENSNSGEFGYGAKPTSVLVLGGTGFIGQALVRHLVAAGHGVRLLARDPRHLPKALHGVPLEVMSGDLAKIEELERAMSGITTVCHLARAHVKTWDEYVRLEIGGTRNVAEACLKAGVKRFLHTGTIDSYYTGADVTIGDSMPLDPKIERRNLYARAKAESERLLWDLQREKGLPLAILRPGIVIGSGGNPFHWGVGMWTANSVCRLWGRGDNPLPIVLVDDVARALVKAVDADGVIGETFNLVGAPLLTAQDYVAELEKAARIKIDVHSTPPFRFYRNDLFKWVIKVLVRHPERRFPSYRDWKSRTQRAVFDCAKAKLLLGWAPVVDRETIVRDGITLPVKEWLE